MIIQMTVRPPFMFITTHVLQKLVTNRTPETIRMPSLTHGTHDATDDGTVAPPARETVCTRRGIGGRWGRKDAFGSGTGSGGGM